MIHKSTTIIGLTLIFLSGYGLFSMKHEVETLNFELSQIQNQVNNEKGNINLLKTEYVYLTSPSRLSKLAAKYLKLSNAQPEQMMPDPTTESTQTLALDTINEKSNITAYKTHITSATTSKSVMWRYKRMGSQYLHKASLNKKQ